MKTIGHIKQSGTKLVRLGKNNANKYYSKWCLCLLLIAALIPLNAIGQNDSCALSDFLNYFTRQYLPTQNLYKINDKIRKNTFSERRKNFVYWYSLSLNTDTSMLNAAEKKQLLGSLYTDAEPLALKNYVSDSFLVDIDSFYMYDSLMDVHARAFYDKYPKYQLLLNQKKSEELPDSVIQFYQTNDKLKSDFFNKAYKISADMVEISTPYFFDNNSKCVIAYVGHLIQFNDSKLLFFQRQQNKWILKKTLILNKTHD